MPIDRAADLPLRTLTCAKCGVQFPKTDTNKPGQEAYEHSEKTKHTGFHWV